MDLVAHPRLQRHARQADGRRLHRADLAMWSEVMARTLAMGGAAGYGRAQRVRLRAVHWRPWLSHGRRADRLHRHPDVGRLYRRQVLMLEDMGGELLGAPRRTRSTSPRCWPSRVSIRTRCKLQIGLFGAEPWTEEMRTELERELGLTALNVYGLSEIVGRESRPSASRCATADTCRRTTFCPRSSIRPTGTPLPAGQEGELVFTTLTKEALPLVRYRTGDISSLDPRRACAGGRRRAWRAFGPLRRHADRSRRQPVPVRGRAHPAQPGARGAALPARRGPPGGRWTS